MHAAFPIPTHLTSSTKKRYSKDQLMASLPARLILPLLLLFGTCCANLISSGDVLEAQKEFDYFNLALYWPGTICQSVKQCCSTNGCCRSDAVTGFTIHALWPDYNDGTWPSCCEGPKYDENEISNLMDDLNKYWPSYNCTSSSTCGNPKGSIWQNQWEKHGTCASPVLESPYEYFATALYLYLRYDVTAVLAESGYVPSNSDKYPLEGITSAIQNAFGATPLVTCYGDALREVQLCFDKTLKPKDCPTESSIQSAMLSKKSSECPSHVSLPIKNATPLGTMNLPFHGVLGRSPINAY